jgi:hypothetical protein
MTQPTADEDIPFPLNSLDLLKDLHAGYPARCILPGQPPEDAHRYAGKRELIDDLLAWAAEHGHRVNDRD